jgi:hypothetical protein
MKMKPIKPHEGITFQQLEQLTGGTTNAQEALQAVRDDDNKPSRFIQGINTKQRTKNMISKPATDGKFNKPGSYNALLEKITCYTNPNFNTQIPEPVLAFHFNLGDLENTGKDIYHTSYINLRTDDDGIPVMGGKDSRYYKIVSAAYGDLFDPKDPKTQIDIGFPETYNSPEGIMAMPGFKDYQEKEPHLQLKDYKVAGKNIIGTEITIKLDYPKKPDGTPGKAIAIVEAATIAKTVARRSTQPQPQQQASAPQ